jgi:hypothetical protein
LAVDEGGEVLVWVGAEARLPHRTTPRSTRRCPIPRRISPRRFCTPVLPSKVSASWSRCSLLTSKAPPS